MSFLKLTQSDREFFEKISHDDWSANIARGFLFVNKVALFIKAQLPTCRHALSSSKDSQCTHIA